MTDERIERSPKRCADEQCVDGWTTVIRWARVQLVPCPVCQPETARAVAHETEVGT